MCHGQEGIGIQQFGAGSGSAQQFNLGAVFQTCAQRHQHAAKRGHTGAGGQQQVARCAVVGLQAEATKWPGAHDDRTQRQLTQITAGRTFGQQADSQLPASRFALRSRSIGQGKTAPLFNAVHVGEKQLHELAGLECQCQTIGLDQNQMQNLGCQPAAFDQTQRDMGRHGKSDQDKPIY